MKIVGIYKKNTVLNFNSFNTVSFYFFLFSMYKMVDIMDISIMEESLSISIETVMKNPEMSKFVHDHLKTKKMCKHEVKKLPYMLRYVPD